MFTVYIELCLSVLLKAKEDNMLSPNYGAMWREFKETPIYSKGEAGQVQSMEVAQWVCRYMREIKSRKD